MENKYYQLYTDSIMELAGSLVIKSHMAALAINSWVDIATNEVYDLHDLKTWKYYKNISGQYFGSDTVMTVTSIDSLETIVFSKENLQFHAATKKAYEFGSTYYKELVDLYPEQEQLIRGILYPADIDEAVLAPEGAILSYPASLVEPTEPSTIPKLQEFIYGYYKRWENNQYDNTDNLYRTAFLAVLYAFLPSAIENIRKQACLTYEAHSYHVKQYLASHSQLDKYLPYMTRKQAMFFYHNLSMIEKNNGKQEIFDKLLEKVFTDRQLPLGHFSLRHSTEAMPESLVPVVVFDKQPLNTEKNIDSIDQYTLSQVLDIEDVIVPNNVNYREEQQRLSAVLTANTHTPNLPTKLLQSTVVDYSGSEHFKLSDIALNHWLYLTQLNLYGAFVTVTIPSSGAKYTLSAKDAFSFYAYALCKGFGLEINKLPVVTANRVQRLPMTPLASLREVCLPQFVPDEWLTGIIGTMPAAVRMISVDSFRTHVENLFVAANEQYARVVFEEKMTARGQKEAAACRLWQTNNYYLGDYPNQNYQSWFEERNIILDELSREQYTELAGLIFSEAVGENLASVITLKDIQRAMANIFLDLSSYSIQIGLNINSGPMLDVCFPAIRTDDPDTSTEGALYYIIPTALPVDVKITSEHDVEWDIVKDTEFTAQQIALDKEMTYPLQSVSYGTHQNSNLVYPEITIERNYAIGVGFDCEVNLTVPNPRGLVIVPGMEEFLKLPLETQLASYVDTWAS